MTYARTLQRTYASAPPPSRPGYPLYGAFHYNHALYRSISLIGPAMKAAARATYPDYNGNFILGMTERESLGTFVWLGLNWTASLVLQRLGWLVISMGVALLGSLFFNRFDPTSRSRSKSGPKILSTEGEIPEEESHTPHTDLKVAPWTPLGDRSPLTNRGE